ncbi:hypothetical protein Gotur_019088 [Gossypium turneri]
MDIGDGKELSLKKCQKTSLQQQCINYLRPKEREAFEVFVDSGKLVYKQSGLLVNTIDDSKWIFAIWPYSGHYLPTEDNFKEFIIFLEGQNVDLTNVKRCAVDDDYAACKVAVDESKHGEIKDPTTTALEQVNLSPRIEHGRFENCSPIPSPRSSPKIHVSPRLAYMGLPSPRVSVMVANWKLTEHSPIGFNIHY